MAESQSTSKGQFPIICQFCENDTKIKWKCLDCDKLMCDNCKERINPVFAKDHRTIDIKEVGLHSEETIGLHSKETKLNKVNSPKCELSAAMEYTTTITNVQLVSVVDKSIWISNSITEEEEEILKARYTSEGLLVKFSLRYLVYDMAVTPANDLLLCVSGPRLKQILDGMEEIIDSKHMVMDGLQPTSVHVTKDGQVIVGAWAVANNRNVVIIMDKEGQYETIFENDKKNQPIFRCPKSITMTNNRNIFVADCRAQDNDGKVIVLDKNGELVNIYTGHSSINAHSVPFRSESVATTPLDNVITADMDNHYLHVLDNSGNLLQYYDSTEKGILYPCALAFDTVGKLYIGCSRSTNSEEMANIYIMNSLGI